MTKKKILLIISVLVVLGGSITTAIVYKKYSDNQNRAYIQSSISKINSDIASNNLDAANTELKNLTDRSKGLNDKNLTDEVNNLTTKLIKQENQNQIIADLKNLSSLIDKGSLSEASFEAQKIAGEDLTPADTQQLQNLETKLKNAKSDQTTATVEENAMNTISNLMDEGKYENAHDFIENLNTAGFSDDALAKIAAYSKQIQTYQNQFKIDDYDIPSSQLTGLYKEAFPTSTDTVSISSTLPVYFIGQTPVYKVTTSSAQTPVVYLSADGKNVTATQFTTELNNKNLYAIDNGQKVLATSIPSDAK
ncbi:MAG: hypothetical protein ACRCTZ_24005 [Sarcina sp.]